MVRLHSMDALRAIAMFLGVLLHAMMSYQHEPRIEWPQDLDYNSIIFDIIYNWIHAFRMPLFFLVAGFFARFLYYRIGYKKFIKHRYNRIIIPFIFSLIIIIPFSVFPFQYYLVHQKGLSFIDTIQLALTQTFRWNGLLHLWFLYYLIIMYSLMILIIRFAKKLNLTRYQKFQFTYRPISLLAASTFLGLIFYFFYDIKVEPWGGVSIKLGQVLFYGLFFFLGYTMQRNVNTLQSGSRFMWIYLTIGLLLQIPLYLLKVEYYTNEEAYLIIKLSHNMLHAFQVFLLTFGMLALFTKLFHKENKAIRYFSDASYWIYLIHFPIVISVQIWLMKSMVPGYLRFYIVLLITTVFSFFTYHYLVRFTIIGNYLHGSRHKELTMHTTADT